MFYAKEIKREDSLNSIERGVTFIQANKALIFEFGFKDNSNLPVEINFKILNDKNKKPIEVEVTDLIERKLNIIVYNPTYGTSGLKEPADILQNDKLMVKFMFHIETLNDSEFYKLTYEFFFQPKNQEI